MTANFETTHLRGRGLAGLVFEVGFTAEDFNMKEAASVALHLTHHFK